MERLPQHNLLYLSIPMCNLKDITSVPIVPPLSFMRLLLREFSDVHIYISQVHHLGSKMLANGIGNRLRGKLVCRVAKLPRRVAAIGV
jgi:hypothetical protein